mmetsp:Transcript_4/g.11  ORF Transcript_4/g.11 Transcript_4/m.11 type:complete len:84 (+) Transcript_4:532-783(+)
MLNHKMHRRKIQVGPPTHSDCCVDVRKGTISRGHQPFMIKTTTNKQTNPLRCPLNLSEGLLEHSQLTCACLTTPVHHSISTVS